MRKQKSLLMMGIAVFTLIVCVLGATYAYFIAQGGGSGNTDVKVQTSTTDNLSFSFGDEIYIEANESNFAEGMLSLSDSTVGSAKLTANNATNTASATYNIYLIIENNDFEYTTADQKPELMLTITDPNGKEVENITGLVHYEGGFDITTRTGGYLIISDYEISATEIEAVQDWNIEVTFVNLDSDQSANAGKSLTGKLYLTQDKMSSYELAEINNIITTTSYDSITATLDITHGSGEINKYYYGIEKNTVESTLAVEDVNFIETTEDTYTFEGLEANSSYTVYSYVEDENKIMSNVYETTVETGDFVAPSIKAVSHSETLDSISITVDAQAGSNEISKYMYSKDDGKTWEESETNSYTFEGLTDTTEYKIKVKVVDSKGNESPEYYEAITTEVYILPVVTSVNATTTYNSITLTPTGTDGTNSISKYMYSIGDGEYQDSNVFNNLSESTSYDIKVKAIDSIGRESNVYSLNVTTDAYRVPTITGVTTNNSLNSITININSSAGDAAVSKYFFSKDGGSTYKESQTNSYTFENLTPSTTFYIETYVEDVNGRKSSIYSTTAQTQAIEFATYISDYLYTTDGANSLYLHDGSGTYGSQEALDNSYRYAGSNPNNYVCFGSDVATCPEDNLYRIIGVFGDQVKLIKNTTAGTNSWSIPTEPFGYPMIQGIYFSNWTICYMRMIISSFFNNFDSKWQSMISQYNWESAGVSNLSNNVPKNVFTNEITNNSTVVSANVGLMYASDYGYAASPNYWNTALSSYNSAKGSNWLALGLDEWLIAATSSITISAYMINSSGQMAEGTIYTTYNYRPTIYLNSTVKLDSGDGTHDKPYRLVTN